MVLMLKQTQVTSKELSLQKGEQRNKESKVQVMEKGLELVTIALWH